MSTRKLRSANHGDMERVAIGVRSPSMKRGQKPQLHNLATDHDQPPQSRFEAPSPGTVDAIKQLNTFVFPRPPGPLSRRDANKRQSATLGPVAVPLGLEDELVSPRTVTRRDIRRHHMSPRFRVSSGRNNYKREAGAQPSPTYSAYVPEIIDKAVGYTAMWQAHSKRLEAHIQCARESVQILKEMHEYATSTRRPLQADAVDWTYGRDFWGLQQEIMKIRMLWQQDDEHL